MIQVAIGTGVDGQGWNWTLADFCLFCFCTYVWYRVRIRMLVKKTDQPVRRYSIGIILAVIFALIWIQAAVEIFDKQEYKLVVRDKYTFEVPVEWIVADARDVDRCSWDAVVNDRQMVTGKMEKWEYTRKAASTLTYREANKSNRKKRWVLYHCVL